MEEPSRSSAGGARRAVVIAVVAVVVMAGLVFAAVAMSRPERLAGLRGRAEAAARKKDWPEALRLWRLANAGPGANARTWLEEGKAALALGRAAQGDRALRKAVEADPKAVKAWALRLEILRVEDRWLDADAIGRGALEHVAPEDRAAILRELTLSALTELPDDLARNTLRKWIAADPADYEAEAALLKRIGTDPRSDDPDRSVRLARLEELVAEHPDQPSPREALATLLADGGEIDRGREVLNAWPESARDARYDRLQGRWNLDFEGRPAEAAEAFERVLKAAPHDWRAHYRLARALTILGRRDEAAREARTTARIREALDPMTLGPALEDAFARVDRSSSRATIADACARVGLERLARAWRELPPAPAPSGDEGGFGAGKAQAGPGTSRPMAL